MIRLKYFINLTLCILFFGCAALKNNNDKITPSIDARINLVDINEDKVNIDISPSRVEKDQIIFYIPQIVPGTYEYSNFGRFIEDFKAFDEKGNLLTIE